MVFCLLCVRNRSITQKIAKITMGDSMAAAPVLGHTLDIATFQLPHPSRSVSHEIFNTSHRKNMRKNTLKMAK